MLFRCLLFFTYPILSLTASVTIDNDVPYEAHDCVEICLDSQGSFQNEDDIGHILECGSPYNEACYCATESASASAVSNFINDCASKRCAKGDMTRDISTIRSIYASYCSQAGFTQPLVSEWYTNAGGPDETATSTAEPSQTQESGAAGTITDTTLVTQTAASEDGATGSRGEFLLAAVLVPAAVMLQLL